MKSAVLSVVLATLAAASAVVFQRGQDYTYEYLGVVENVFLGTTDSKSGYKFSCRLSVSIPRQNEAILKIITCHLYERLSGGGKRYTERESRIFARKLKRFPIHIRFREGYVVPNGITVHPHETLEVLNVKRGMVSSLQYPASTRGLFSGKKTITDVYGECSAMFKRVTPTIISSDRDLTACKQPHFSLFQREYLSEIQQLDGGYSRIDFIPFGYQFITTANCKYKVKNNQLKRVTCFQDHKFIHGSRVSSKGKLISFGSEITQELILRTKRTRYTSLGLRRTRRVGLEFEFEPKHRQDATGHEIYHHVEAIVAAMESKAMKDVAKHFEELLDTTRRGTEKELARVFRTIPYCTKCSKKQKTIMEVVYADSLRSCGTGECISALLRYHSDKKTGGRPLKKFLVDVMLNHDPLESTIGHVVDICKSKRTTKCAMLLSGMVRNYALKHSDKDVKNPNSPLYKAIEFVLDTFSSTCSSRTHVIKDDEQQTEILAAIKGVGNLGHIAQVHDTVAPRSVISTIITCIENPTLSEEIVKASIMSLQKMNFDAKIRELLFAVIKKVDAVMAYRTSAFLVLVRDETQSTVEQLHNIIHDEESSNMRNFMLSYIKNMLQSMQGSYKKIQELWRTVIKNHEGALPELDVLMFHKSRYTELSRQILLPLSQKNIGIQIGFTVVYEPGNLLPRSVSFNVSVTVLDHVYNVAEFGADLMGLETFTEAVMGDKELFGDKRTREKISILSNYVEQTPESIKKVAKDAEKAKKEIEKAKDLGILEENELDWRIVNALPVDFDPSVIPNNIDPVKYAKKYLRSLPPGETKNQLAQAIKEVESEKKEQGGDLAPGVEEVMKMVLFKPDFKYVKTAYRRLLKKIFDDVNYPRMSFPSGGFYMKMFGNEFVYFSMLDIFKFVQNFASMEKMLEYIDFFKLLSEITAGKEIALHQFYEVVHKATVIPTLIGVPMNMSLKGLHVRMLDGNLKVTINSKAAVPNVDINGYIRPRHTGLMTGTLYINVPTRQEYVGIHTNFTMQADVSTEGSIKYLPKSVAQMTKPKSIKIFHKNYDQPTDLFSSEAIMCLKHWRDMEPIPGRQEYHTTKEICSPSVLETVTGRKACIIADYYNTSGVDDQAFFPLNGPFKFSYRVIPSKNPVKRNILTVDFDKKPCPHHPKHMLDLIKVQYEGEDQFGSTAHHKVVTDITLNRRTGNFKSDTKTPLFGDSEVKVEYTYRSSGKGYGSKAEPHGSTPEPEGPSKSSMRKDIIAEILKGGKKIYGLKYYRTWTVEQERVRNAYTKQVAMRPVLKGTVFVNYTMRDMSFEATVHRQRSLYGLDISSDITAHYFCNMVDSPLYQIHLNPDAAKANGHLTTFTGNSFMKKKQIGEKDYELKHEHVFKYPGQECKLDHVITSEKRGTAATGKININYIDSHSVPQEIVVDETYASTMNMRLHAKEIDYNMVIRHKKQYEATVETKIIATGVKITASSDISYKKIQHRRKRSLSDTLWGYERRFVKAISARLYPREHMMSDTGDYVDWNNWKASGKLVVNNFLGHTRSPAGGSLDVTLDVTYPREDKYHDIKANMMYQAKKFSFRQGHGRHNLTFGLQSSFLQSGFDFGIGYSGMLFGDEFHYKEYLIINDLKTGDKWPLYNVIYDRLTDGPKAKLFIDVKFKTLRTDYKFHVDFDGIYMKDLTNNVDIYLKSKIAPILDHYYTDSTRMKNSVATGKVTAKCAWFEMEQEYETRMPTRTKFEYRMNNKIMFKSYAGNIYDSTLDVVLNKRGRTMASLLITERDSGTKYSVRADLINPKRITIKTYKQKRGEGRLDGLTWTLNKINPYQIEHDMRWSKRFGDMFYEKTTKTLKYLAHRWSNMAIMFLSNVNKPFMEKVLPYSHGMTVRDVYEKHVKPRIEETLSKLDAYKIFGKPLGQMIREKILKIRSVRLHSMKMLRETVLAKFLIQLGPITRLRALIGEGGPWAIRYWQKHPPEIIVGYFRRAYLPKLEKIRADRHYKYVFTYPLIQETFMDMPELPAWAESYFAWLENLIESPYDTKGRLAQAITFPPNHVYTFDGRIFSIPETRSSCSYLLSSDFKYARFSIVKTNDRVTFYSKNITFSIDKDNKVYLDQSRIAAELPVKSDGVIIAQHGATLSADLPHHGVYIYCDQIHHICRYELGSKHYNHSMGLFGRNDEEYITDFYTPNGEKTENVHTLLNQYDLSGRCRHNENAFTLPSETRQCTRPHPICSEAFDNDHSPLAECFTIVQAHEFLEACNYETSKCGVRYPEKVACGLVKAYTHLCEAKDVDIDYFPKCVQCHGHSLGSHSWSERVVNSKVDYAIVVATSAGMGGQHNHFPKYIHDFLDKIHTRGSQYALITFDGDKSKIHGDFKRPFGTIQRLKYRLRRERLSKTRLTFGADIQAVYEAMFLPYRDDSHHRVILFTETIPAPHSRDTEIDDLVDRLDENSISLHVVSTYGFMDNEQITALGHDGIIPKSTRPLPVALPLDEIGEAIYESNGYLFHRGRMMHPKGRYLDKVARLIKSHNTVPKGKCRKCKCSVGDLGQGMLVCHYVNC